MQQKFTGLDRERSLFSCARVIAGVVLLLVLWTHPCVAMSSTMMYTTSAIRHRVLHRPGASSKSSNDLGHGFIPRKRHLSTSAISDAASASIASSIENSSNEECSARNNGHTQSHPSRCVSSGEKFILSPEEMSESSQSSEHRSPSVASLKAHATPRRVKNSSRAVYRKSSDSHAIYHAPDSIPKSLWPPLLKRWLKISVLTALAVCVLAFLTCGGILLAAAGVAGTVLVCAALAVVAVFACTTMFTISAVTCIGISSALFIGAVVLCCGLAFEFCKWVCHGLLAISQCVAQQY